MGGRWSDLPEIFNVCLHFKYLSDMRWLFTIWSFSNPPIWIDFIPLNISPRTYNNASVTLLSLTAKWKTYATISTHESEAHSGPRSLQHQAKDVNALYRNFLTILQADQLEDYPELPISHSRVGNSDVEIERRKYRNHIVGLWRVVAGRDLRARFYARALDIRHWNSNNPWDEIQITVRNHIPGTSPQIGNPISRFSGRERNRWMQKIPESIFPEIML